MSFLDAPRVVTSRFEHEDSHTLSRFVSTGGYDGLRRALTMTPEEVAAQVDASGIIGRGGAGFPTGRKWSMLRPAPVRYLVINGDESEPATFKDHALVTRDPNQLVEGALLAAYAVQATQVFLYVRGEFALGLERVQAALNDAYRLGAVGRDIFGSGFSVDAIVHPGAGAYICGDETALLESLEGKRGFPRVKPPYYPAVTGLYREPTIVNNVETVSSLPWIINHGGAAFAALGAPTSTGTRVFALAGDVMRPGNYEIELSKPTFRDLIFAPELGGGLRPGRSLKAIVPGGTSAFWIGPDRLDLHLDQKAVADAGTMLGSGSVVVMDDTQCMVRAAWRISRFYRRESCGQCTPCREGSGWVENILRRIEAGSGHEDDLGVLLDICDNISPEVSWPSKWPPQQTTLCPLGPSIPPAVVSSIGMFRDEYMVHIKDGGCPFD